jgi:hypothetical protein
MRAAKPPLIDAVVFVVFILVWFILQLSLLLLGAHAGFHSAKALLSKTSNGFFI